MGVEVRVAGGGGWTLWRRGFQEVGGEREAQQGQGQLLLPRAGTLLPGEVSQRWEHELLHRDGGGERPSAKAVKKAAHHLNCSSSAEDGGLLRSDCGGELPYRHVTTPGAALPSRDHFLTLLRG